VNLGPFKDRRVQLAAAGAAGLGLIVLLRRGGGDASAADAGAGQSVNTGTLDSTGTDTYNAISQIGQAWQDTWNQSFAGFQDSLTGIGDQLAQMQQPAGGTTPPPASTKVPGVYAPPPVKSTLKPGVGWYRVRKGDTLGSIAQRWNMPASKLFELNTKNALNRLSVGEWVRVRGIAGARPS